MGGVGGRGLFWRRVQRARGQGRDLLWELGFRSWKQAFETTSATGSDETRGPDEEKQPSSENRDLLPAGESLAAGATASGDEDNTPNYVDEATERSSNASSTVGEQDTRLTSAPDEETGDARDVPSPTLTHLNFDQFPDTVAEEEASMRFPWEGWVLDQSDEFWDALVGPDDGSLAFILGTDGEAENKRQREEDEDIVSERCKRRRDGLGLA